jgi:phosphorylcholine metabolism protein LicD
MNIVKSQAILNLTDFYYVAKKHNIPFYLFEGTLVGAYRDNDFCPGDEDDIDLGIWDKDYDKLELAIRELVERYNFIVTKTFHHSGKMEGVAIQRGENHIDLIRVHNHPERPETYNFCRYFGQDEDKIKRGTVMVCVYPSECMDGFTKHTFYGLNCLIPKDADMYLTSRYGDYRTEIKREDFDWYSMSNTDTILTEYDMIKGE